MFRWLVLSNTKARGTARDGGLAMSHVRAFEISPVIIVNPSCS